MLSIVITSYDPQRKKDISDLLDSIKNQVCNNFEVVYVTERNSWLHDYVKAAIKSRDINGKVIHNTGQRGLSECRNIGIKNSEGDIVAFVDDDVILDPKWSCSVITAFKSFSEMIGATGPAYPYWVAEKADWLPLELDWLIGCTRWFRSEVPVEVRNCWGMNMVFRREAFERVGVFSLKTGYHRGYLAEDVEFSLRVKRLSGKKLFYLPDMKVLNKVYSYRLSTRFIITRSSWIGYSRRTILEMAGRQELAKENSLLISLLRGLLKPDHHRLQLYGELQSVKVIILALFSLSFGYLVGPVA